MKPYQMALTKYLHKTRLVTDVSTLPMSYPEANKQLAEGLSEIAEDELSKKIDEYLLKVID